MFAYYKCSPRTFIVSLLVYHTNRIMYFVKFMFDILSPKWDEHISGGSFVTLSNLIQMVYFGIFTLNKRYNFVYTDGINDYTFCIDILSYWVVYEVGTT